MIRPSKSKTRARTGGGPGEAGGGDGTGTFSGQPRTRFQRRRPLAVTSPAGVHTRNARRDLGASPPRREDPRLLTGRGRFVDDQPGAGGLHAVFVRSPLA